MIKRKPPNIGHNVSSIAYRSGQFDGALDRASRGLAKGRSDSIPPTICAPCPSSLAPALLAWTFLWRDAAAARLRG